MPRSAPNVVQAQGTAAGSADERSLLRYALATASIYSICGYGPPGSAPNSLARTSQMPGPLDAIRF